MFARTERLLLRPGFVEDAPELAAAIGHDVVVRNLATAPSPYGVEDAHRFLAMESDPLRPNFLITQRTAGTPRIIGGIGISSSETGGPELGYWIAPSHWGLGFATEAGRAVLHIARSMGLPKLKAGYFIDNPASGKVLRKLGFRPTGQVVQRHSDARGREVSMVELEEGDASADGMPDVKPLRALDHIMFEQDRMLAA